jgi:restriction system protein
MAKKTVHSQMPRYGDFFNPLLSALKQLGGSATIDEMNTKIVELINLPQEVLDVLHDPGKSNATEVEYRLAWARTYLRIYGLLENSSRGVWSLTKAADKVDAVDVTEVRRFVNERAKKRGKPAPTNKPHQGDEDEEIGNEDFPTANWREELFGVLTKQMDPSAFERLVQRLLRESGFIQVEVTGRSGDGGIDGKGIARINGLMSFHVVFQCKRYSGVVSPSQVRDFRGSMIGRADKGLFITTGTFSKEAAKEAIRDGAPPIDLLDGDALADKLKELGLGIRVKMVEAVEVDADWFAGI